MSGPWEHELTLVALMSFPWDPRPFPQGPLPFISPEPELWSRCSCLLDGPWTSAVGGCCPGWTPVLLAEHPGWPLRLVHLMMWLWLLRVPAPGTVSCWWGDPYAGAPRWPLSVDCVSVHLTTCFRSVCSWNCSVQGQIFARIREKINNKKNRKQKSNPAEIIIFS